MDYQALYQQKLTTPEEAVKVVKSGDWVDYTWCTNHPIALDKALAARKDELTDVKVRGGVTMRMPVIAKARDVDEHFVWNSRHGHGPSRPLLRTDSGPGAVFKGTPMDVPGNFTSSPARSPRLTPSATAGGGTVAAAFRSCGACLLPHRILAGSRKRSRPFYACFHEKYRIFW